ncbi:hypothetical protein O988_03109 [Pseudogymnoascus sp. VKM F-3808]|nr:hypothetical protein O988_03109 [Pseudogymnoascus sp. VKM F-3808]
MASCWTCKDRKISCDRRFPACIKCSRSKRRCGGYGLRLSWPVLPDRKRAIVGVAPCGNNIRNVISPRDLRCINAFSKDIHLYYNATLFKEGFCGKGILEKLVPPCPPETMPWTPCKVAALDNDLLEYFEMVVSNTLAMLDTDRNRIRRLLLQMALSDNTPSSRAVLLSILALSSLHRDGQQDHAAQLKLSAIRALMASPEEHLSPEAAIKHIAAGILLSSFEMLRKDSSWVGHICGAKGVITALQGQRYAPGSDISVILGWIYYYDVMTRFSIRHWRINMLQEASSDNKWPPNLCEMQFVFARISFARQIPDIFTHSHKVVQLLYEVCSNTLLYAWGPQYHNAEYRKYLDGLELRLTESISLPSPDIGAATREVNEEMSPVLELFRISALVYLERASRNFSGQSTKLDQWVEDSFSILTNLNTCQHPFPLFILGCEARTDSRRIAVLDLIAKTEEHLYVRDLQEVRELIQSMWVQEDLDVNGEVGFIEKLNLVLSSSGVVPGFV